MTTYAGADRTGVPGVSLPTVPRGSVIWRRAIIVAAVAIGFFFLDKISLLFMDFWLLDSLGFESVFWTNFWMGAVLFAAGLVGVGAAVTLPAYTSGVPRTLRRPALGIGVLVGLLAGYWFTGSYQKYLLFLNGRPFGEDDPVFGHDLAFYVFDLPAVFSMLHAAMLGLAVLVVSAAVWAYVANRDRPAPEGMRRLPALVGTMSTRLTVIALVVLGTVTAFRVWLERYDVLLKDNADATIATGADYLDVNGFFSTVNEYTVAALAIFFGIGALALRLRALHRSATAPSGVNWRRIGVVSLVFALLPGLAIDFAFRGMVALRNETQVTPNEPVIQLPYIDRHVQATQAAYGLDRVERIDFTPAGPDDPLPNIDELLASPTIRNAGLWPGFAAWFETQVDPEYVPRILASEGDTMIYGPTLDIFNAQQKLRPYYDFMDVDTVRYHVDGEDMLFSSAVRELPLVEPQPWLAWWGQQYVLFTHGYGLVAAPVSQGNAIGEPEYASFAIPPEVRFPELAVENNSVYYGEGSGSIGFSNVRGVAEHDYPTEQGRAEVFFPEDVEAGVRIDSFLKRLVFGYKSRQFLDVLFSDLIGADTRIHYFRTPLERVEHVAPFLFADSDPYAVAAEDRITWMINGLTTTDRYPYSDHQELGDKSHVRTPTPKGVEVVNYVKDSVKITVDAYTGQIDFYKWSDEPIVDSWAAIYPDLFTSGDEMPSEVREQVQYPPQLLHVQFDDVYWYYHMDDPLTFFSFEDAMDDADEVIGAILDEGRSITFSIEPYYWIAETGGVLPETEDPNQFAVSLVFTPEGALNLRSIVTAYQEGDDYGRISMLQVPKGHFFPGPEQADAAIDQDAFISQQIGLWNRQGLEVIRGHTTPLVVGNEVIYVEPLFIRSVQNPVPQMKRVVVVFRGQAVMGQNLEEALRAAVSGDLPTELDENVSGDLPAGEPDVPLEQAFGQEGP